MANERSTTPDWLTTADAVRLLDAPHRGSPSLLDTARTPFAFGLLLVPAILILAGIGGVVSMLAALLTLPTH